MSRIAYIVLLFIFVSPLLDVPSDYIYIICASSIVPIGIVGCALGKRTRFLRSGGFISWLPIVMFGLWGYGVVLGFLLGNEPLYIFRNFAGMTLYLSFYFFVYIKFSFQDFYRLMSLVAIVAFIAVVIGTDYSRLLSVSEYDNIGSAKSYRSNTLLYLVPFLSVWLILPLEKIRLKGVVVYKIILPMIVVFYLTVPTVSKGNILIVFAICIVSIIYGIRRNDKLYLLFVSSFLLAVFSYVQYSGYEFTSLSQLFSSSNTSNYVRSQQLEIIIENLSVFGNGLGAELAGYSRRGDLAYGLELTYLSVIHKVGIFSVLFFTVLYITIVGIYKLKDTKKKIFCFGAMLYLIPAAGNPILFSPQLVLIHSAVLSLLIRSATNLNKSRRGGGVPVKL